MSSQTILFSSDAITPPSIKKRNNRGFLQEQRDNAGIGAGQFFEPWMRPKIQSQRIDAEQPNF
jgi:hypothetical protein